MKLATMTEPLVILPGLICDETMFSAQVRAFRATVIGGFYGGADRITTMAHYALERLPETCALLGHSMGARVALEIWRIAPEKVSRLALANTGVHGPRPVSGTRCAIWGGTRATVRWWTPGCPP